MSYGHEWEYIYNHGANTEFRQLRPDPNVIYPGDELKIPEKEEGNEGRPIDDTHKFKVRGVPWRLAIVIRDIKHKPVPDLKWHLIIDSEPTGEQTTGEDGLMEDKIPAGTRSAVLVVEGVEVPLQLHELDPANTVHGIQQRLRNMGYDVGMPDGYLGPRTRDAVRRFQKVEKRNGLDVSGYPDERTIKQLRILHENVNLSGSHNELTESRPPNESPPSGDDPDSDSDSEPEADVDEDEERFDHEIELAGDPSRPMSIYALQVALTQFGYRPGPIDGLNGPLTSSGVRSFQTTHDLLIDGIAGPQTWTHLRNVYNGNI